MFEIGVMALVEDPRAGVAQLGAESHADNVFFAVSFWLKIGSEMEGASDTPEPRSKEF